MNAHPSTHLDVARERQHGLIARAERHCLAEAAQRAAAPRVRLVARLRTFGRSVLLRRKARSADEQSRTPRAAGEPWFRELAHRIDGGVDVTLLWSSRENRLAVTVFDEHAVELLVLEAESDKALDVFYHPYAHTR